MEKFKKKFVNEFGGFLKEVNVKLPGDINVQTVADRLFYENGRDFVLRRLDAINEAATPAAAAVAAQV